jgi:tRNA dimethylallyltransferase
MLTILGPTATGKTSFAAHIAAQLNGEIISADSRQVYRGMDIGTGKDYDDYIVDALSIPYHLIDIVDPGYEYNVFEFRRDFMAAYNDILYREKYPILCGGTGMYIESILKGYTLVNVEVNKKIRQDLESKTDEELIRILVSYKVPHNITDTSDRQRLIRAIEIQEYYKLHPNEVIDYENIDSIIFGLSLERQKVRDRITARLHWRLEHGMVEEVERLLDEGVSSEKLLFYGLEYKFITKYILGEIGYDVMVKRLNIAIHQFSKRQMTWFRRMERAGFQINWIDGELSMGERLEKVFNVLNV